MVCSLVSDMFRWGAGVDSFGSFEASVAWFNEHTCGKLCPQAHPAQLRD